MLPITIRRAVGSRAALCAALASATLIAVACNDITAPIRQTPGPATLLVNPSGTVIVTPDSLHGWGFYNDQQGVTCGDTLMCHMVVGPKTTPAGTGSAELATNAAADGNALILADYGGTRFDHITDLRYSTYRQSTDAGHNLAIALQMNVDYDLGDQANGYQGRIVFEPYQGNGGNVSDTTWQSWDTRAGKWWGTRATVTVNGASRANPCVQSSPCTWPALLATFPNIGVHATYGALILKAGSGWTNFRGNVDLLTIAVDGTPTTFDFELHRPTGAVGYRLRVVADAGVVFAQPMPRDTILPPGSTVPFSLSAAPGQGTLVTVLDDSLMTASGTIVMNRDHIFYAETEAPLTPSTEVTDIKERLRAVIFSSTPEDALADFITWYHSQSPVVGREVLAARLDTARYLAIDPVADSAAIRAFDTKLNGTEFIFDAYGPVWYMKPEWYGYQPEGPVTSRSSTTRGLIPSGSRASIRAAARTRQLGLKARASSLAADGEPDEQTAILFVNGVYTLGPGEGFSNVGATTELLKLIVITTPRFGTVGQLRQNVSVSYVYNQSVKQDILEWKRDHHCEVEYANERGIGKPFHAILRAVVCSGIPYTQVILDLVESTQQFIQLKLGASGVDHEDVRRVMAAVQGHHESGHHVLLVGHSQGNFMIAQAMGALPDFERRPLNVGNGCTAALTLASPIASSTFPVDPQYLRGMTVEGDILLQVGLPNDFERIHTWLGDSVAKLDGRLDKLRQGAKAHGVEDNYFLVENSANKVRTRLTELSDECSGGLLTLSPSALSMQVGDRAHLDVVLTSRTGRLLRGRSFTGWSPGAFVSGQDSTVLATNITTALNEIDVPLDNTAKVKAHLSVGVTKRRIKTDITYTAQPYWWEVITPAGNGYLPGSEPWPCGTVISGPPPDGGTFKASCRLTYTVKSYTEDGWQLAYVNAVALNPEAMGEPDRTGGVSYTPMDAISQNLLFITDAPANAQFEVTVSDMAYGRPLAVDTVAAQFERKIPWEYASANLMRATFGSRTVPAPSVTALTQSGSNRSPSSKAWLQPGAEAESSAYGHRKPVRE